MHGIPIFVDFVGSAKPRNHKFNDYLSQDIYVLITTGYHEITNPRIYFFLTQSTNNVFLHQLLHIIELVLVLHIAER
jgi:hypothetical protein